MSANDELLDAAIRHSIYLKRYGNGLSVEILKLLNSADDDIRKKLASALSGSLTEKRLQELLTEIRFLNDNVYGEVNSKLDTSLINLATTVAENEADNLTSVVANKSFTASIPPPVKLAALVRTSPIDGYLLKSWTDQMSANRLGRTEREIRLGITQGETVDQIVKRIMGSKEKQFSDGILKKSRDSIKSLVLTANSTVASKAREETYNANERIIRGLQWVSTLDTRTSSICQSRDGEFYELGSEHPQTPAHIRCRSVLVPITKPWNELGIDRKDITPETRASMDGRVPAKTTYGSWLAKQSVERQNDILGNQRAELFRSGKLPFKDMFKEDGSYKNLDELKAAMKSGSAKPKAKPVAPPVATPAPKTRKEVIKELDKGLSQAAADSRYETFTEFRSAKVTDFGRAQLSSALTDDSAVMIGNIHKDLDNLADRFNIPKLRGYKSANFKSIATMGDGMMTLNPTFFNAFNNVEAAGEFVKEKDDALSRLKDLNETIKSFSAQVKGLDRRSPEFEDLLVKYQSERAKYDTLYKEYKKLAKKASATKSASGVASKWKQGDDAKAKPFNAIEYFGTGEERARTVMYHEFGHHVHQMKDKKGPRRQLGRPPVEKEIEELFRSTRSERSQKVASRYGQTSAHEWFAENFALYFMDRKDLVDDAAIKLIERLLDE